MNTVETVAQQVSFLIDRERGLVMVDFGDRTLCLPAQDALTFSMGMAGAARELGVDEDSAMEEIAQGEQLAQLRELTKKSMRSSSMSA